MVDETTNLDQDGAAALEAHFLDPEAPNPARGAAGGMVPGRFRAKARTWRERHHPVSIEQRHTRSALDRRVEYSPDRDGMAWLSAYLPADQAAGIWNRATTAARALQGPTEAGPSPNSVRTTSRRGCSAGTTPMTIPSPTAQVLVTVPVFALMGLTDEPAILDGYGPIPPSMARALVANGAESFRRVLTDPRDGAPLEIGRESYRIPKALRQWLRLRDGKCQFPGCSNPVPGQRSGPPERLGPRREHRDLKPDPALPKTSQAQTQPHPGNPPKPPRTNRPAGSHPPAATTKANNPTRNHPTGQIS